MYLHASKDTVQKLFEAQQPELQGVLRLDIGATVQPRDWFKEIDKDAARIAVGERLLHLLWDFAEDDERKAEQGHKKDKKSGVMVVERIAEKTCVFVKELQPHLKEFFGLKEPCKPVEEATQLLAGDFFAWAKEFPSTAKECRVDVVKNAIVMQFAGPPSRPKGALQGKNEGVSFKDLADFDAFLKGRKS